MDNPWREFIENCIKGDNYFRSSEYMALLADLDRGYAAEARLAEAERLLRDIRKQIIDESTDGFGHCDLLSGDDVITRKIADFLGTASQPPPVITFPDDMSTAERIGDPRIDGQPSVAQPWDRECVKCGCKWIESGCGAACPRCEGNADNGSADATREDRR